MIGQPMIPHSFNIHHPSQAIPQTHTGQRQAYNNQIHTKPNPKKELSIERGPHTFGSPQDSPQYVRVTAGHYPVVQPLSHRP
ncbi:unnamed protein product [Brassica rapa]|uniref:Uncharacterized protein n=1 Tax=Brassica campestris TaxID=3711 RepID=A0A8D9CXS2_BRACM|nr:unnamed protein product [Brassica rapa]